MFLIWFFVETFLPPLPPFVEVCEGHVSAAALADLYRGALCLLFPSLYEGFGLPTLEAMSCGCPVIAADRGASREVAGEGALLVDPESVDEIAAALAHLCADPGSRRSFAERGLARAAEFSWQRCASEHLALFKRTVAGK